ncbi:MAG: rhodanese-like domain-containing protein [Desulfuromonadales bacterium]|nr:rhodanese-like domain-containing protein [Desulfuromonadales bacterium]
MKALSELRRILLEASVLVACGVLIGLSLHHERVLDAFAGRLLPQPAAPATTAVERFPLPVLLDEARDLLAAGALPVDARTPETFAAGHLPGAVSVPLAEAEAAIDRLLQSTPRALPLVVYCGGYGCTDSFDLALLLIERGYRDVRVFEGGFPAWRAAGLAVAGGEL